MISGNVMRNAHPYARLMWRMKPEKSPTAGTAAYPYSIQLSQPSTDSGELSGLLKNEADILKIIRFSDEAHFHSDGYVNKQNGR
jgi:hypothetical protein